MPEVAPFSPTLAAELSSPATDRGRVDILLAAALSRARRRASSPYLRPLFDRMATFLLNGGKRIRPRLTLAAYRIVAGRPGTPPRPVWLAAASLELFHGFMLIHDDLIDGSLVRRGRPTFHEAIRLDDEGGRIGSKRAADLALVCGDLLCAIGTRMIARSGLEDGALARAHRIVADMLIETGLGEALDILFEEAPLDSLEEAQIIDAYLRKTARYSVSCPILLGASLAGAPPRTIKALGRFGDLLGLGYQIQNDLDALAIDADSENPDLDSGKRTIVLWEAHRALPASGPGSLAELLSMPVGPNRRRRLLDRIESSGAVDRCRERLVSLRKEAADVLRGSGLDAERRRAFAGLASLLPRDQVAPTTAEDRQIEAR